MTIKEIWESKEKIVVHCNNAEEEQKLFEKLNELNCKWITGFSYDYELVCEERKGNPSWEKYNYYSNKGTWCHQGEVKEYKIIEFDDLDDFKILTDKEFDYLLGVIKPFIDDVKYIDKWQHFLGSKECIIIGMKNSIGTTDLPYFKIGTMYKGMKPDKLYTLEELGFIKPKKKVKVGEMACQDEITCKDCPLECTSCKHTYAYPMPTLFEQLEITLKKYPQLEPMKEYFVKELNKEKEKNE